MSAEDTLTLINNGCLLGINLSVSYYIFGILRYPDSLYLQFWPGPTSRRQMRKNILSLV